MDQLELTERFVGEPKKEGVAVKLRREVTRL